MEFWRKVRLTKSNFKFDKSIRRIKPSDYYECISGLLSLFQRKGVIIAELSGSENLGNKIISYILEWPNVVCFCETWISRLENITTPLKC